MTDVNSNSSQLDLVINQISDTRLYFMETPGLQTTTHVYLQLHHTISDLITALKDTHGGTKHW